jgi:flagellar motor component MotA
MALASAFSIAPHELEQQEIPKIGTGGINWSGIIGIGMCFSFVCFTLWFAGSFTYFVDLNSILFVLIIPFGLCSLASGFSLTLRTYRTLSWFIIKPEQETNTQQMLPVIRMLIIYCYSSGLLGSFIGFIAIFSNITPTNPDFWTATAIALMPIFWGLLLAELAFRPLKHKIEQLLLNI